MFPSESPPFSCKTCRRRRIMLIDFDDCHEEELSLHVSDDRSRQCYRQTRMVIFSSIFVRGIGTLKTEGERERENEENLGECDVYIMEFLLEWKKTWRLNWMWPILLHVKTDWYDDYRPSIDQIYCPYFSLKYGSARSFVPYDPSFLRCVGLERE